MIRGIERRRIFYRNKDREDLLAGLAELLPHTGTECYAWVLMPNHAHFLFRSGLTSLSSLMRRLLTGYAVRFNLRHQRSGQLFQNRFKSIVVQEDAYLIELVRYIHLNPLRAGLLRGIVELQGYPYSGHSALMGTVERPWQNTQFVLGRFGRTKSQARKGYTDFVMKGLSQGHREDLIGGGLIRSAGGWTRVKSLREAGSEHGMSDERILGDSSFVEGLISRAGEAFERRLRWKRLGVDWDTVAKRVGELFGMDPESFLSKGRYRRKVRPRSLFCYWMVREMGMSMRELAKRLEMSPPAVGQSVARGEGIARENGYRLID